MSGTKVTTRELSVTLPPLHVGQLEVEQSNARYKTLACGRRWGKTRYGTRKVLEIGLRGGRAWWVAPTYKVAAVGWRVLKGLSTQIPGVDKRETDKLITLPSGGTMQVRSADYPDSLRGEGLDLVVIDEAAYVAEAAWQEALRPALSDREGAAIFISTPAGRNWFYREYLKGLDPEVRDVACWSFPTANNPFIKASEIEKARVELPEDIFRQEYLAEFLEGEGAVFRNIKACMYAPEGTTLAQHQGHRLVIGVDWGKQSDFTAISVGCATCRHEVAIDRFNQIDYAFQRGRIQVLAQAWGNPHTEAESNAMGEPIIEQLLRDGLPVSGFATTASSKPPLIENLALALEKEEWQFLPDVVWRGELEAYERKISQTTGRSSYSAPEGFHDDTVIARALMLRASTRYSGPLPEQPAQPSKFAGMMSDTGEGSRWRIR